MRKPHGDRLRVALAFPNTYFVGMSNLGLPDGLPAVQRASRHRVRAVSSCRRSRSWRRSSRPGAPLVTLESQTPVARFRRDRVLGVVRVGLHERPDAAAPGRHSRCARPIATARHPLVVIGGAVTFVNPEPLALFADVIAAGEGEALVPPLVERLRDAVERARPLRRLAAERGFYIPSFYDVEYGADGTIAGYVPREGHRRAARGPQGGAEDDRGGAIRRRPASSRPTPSSDRGSSSKSCAAARTCAASAGRATTTCRCARFRPIASSQLAQAGPAARDRVGLVSIALVRSPGHRAHPAQPAGDGLFDQPGVAAARRPDADHRVAAAGERRAHDHHRARDRLRPPAPRHQQDGDQRRDPRPRPS